MSIRQDGYRSFNRTIDVQSKTEVTVRAALAPTPSRTDAILSYVFAVAFVGGGYYLGGRAADIEKEIEDANGTLDISDPRVGYCKEFSCLTKSGRNNEAGSYGLYGIGAATFALAIYYTFRDKGRPSTGSSDIRAISFEPTITPTSKGFGLAGRF